MASRPDPLLRLRKLALALPEAHEVKAWGEPTFRVKNKLFAMYAGPHTHHGGGRPGGWIKAEPGEQELRIAADPERYFRPPYVGPSGWIGVQLDRGVDWDEVAELLEIAWRLTAPKKLLALVEADAPLRSVSDIRKAKSSNKGATARRPRPGLAKSPAGKRRRTT